LRKRPRGKIPNIDGIETYRHNRLLSDRTLESFWLEKHRRGNSPGLRKVKQGFAEKVFLLIPPEESFRSKRQSKIPYLALSFFCGLNFTDIQSAKVNHEGCGSDKLIFLFCNHRLFKLKRRS